MGLLDVAVVASVLAKKHGSPAPSFVVRAPTPSPDPGFDPSTLIPVLLVVAFVAAAALIAYFSYQAKQRRTAGFIEIAHQLGLTYSPTDVFGLLGYPFAVFQRGDGRGIEHVVYGDWQETHVIAFDYWYYDETSDGKTTSRTYYRFDCVLVPIDADCVRLELGPETLSTKIAGALSFHDQQFESEAFNEAFRVVCDDPRFASALLDARMMQWLLAEGMDHGFELIGNRALITRSRIEPRELPGLLAVGRGFTQHVPAVVSSLYPG